MSIDALKESLPDYAKDLKLNLSSLTQETALTEQQLWGALLATAIAARNPQVMSAIGAQAKQHLSEEAANGARIAAAIMAMNNVYYRFVHLVGGDYKTMPARLRMNAMAKPGVDKIDFELWSLAVSAINGCGMCMESHERLLRDAGASTEAIQAAIRIAATIHAIAVTLETEQHPYSQAAE